MFNAESAQLYEIKNQNYFKDQMRKYRRHSEQSGLGLTSAKTLGQCCKGSKAQGAPWKNWVNLTVLTSKSFHKD